MEPFRSSVLNIVPGAQDQTDAVNAGWESLLSILAAEVQKYLASGDVVTVGIDGYFSASWKTISRQLQTLGNKLHADFELFRMDTCLKSGDEINKIVDKCLPPGEPVFGKVYNGDLSDFYSAAAVRDIGSRIIKIRKQMRSQERPLVLVCMGAGALFASLRKLYDITLYIDVTREQALKRNKAWTEKKSKTQSISPRRIYYVDFPVFDKHRKKCLPRTEFYVDGNIPEEPKTIPVPALLTLIDDLTRMPLRLKPLYEPGVWGGQWLKRNRGLPEDMINCAYGFEIIAPEQSLLIERDGAVIELPFNLLMENACSRVMGEKACRRYHGEFPVRVAYDDTWEGGNLSIQAHPTTEYMKNHFQEHLHQAEMYYIFDAKPGSIVHLGLREGVDKDAFYRAARESEASRLPFDHTAYVNREQAEKGRIYLIPPGTVHGAGANELVLEISSTPYRYTFKIYDYCRPDLDGGFRPIHIEHAFNVIKFFRTKKWVERNLIPLPRLVKTGSSRNGQWKEYIIADRPEFYHVVHRIEFETLYEDDTSGHFHLLNLVEGDIVLVRSKLRKDFERELALSETVLIPRTAGGYEVVNKGKSACKIVKTFLRV